MARATDSSQRSKVVVMLFLVLATLASGLFAGAAVYINLVEHPARLSCGADLALKEFRPSYRRATIMQASLALVGAISGVVAGWLQRDVRILLAAFLLGSVVPFTLVVILPTNRRLLDPALDSRLVDAAVLLRRWAALHAVRSLLASVAFVIYLLRVAHGGFR